MLLLAKALRISPLPPPLGAGVTSGTLGRAGSWPSIHEPTTLKPTELTTGLMMLSMSCGTQRVSITSIDSRTFGRGARFLAGSGSPLQVR